MGAGHAPRAHAAQRVRRPQRKGAECGAWGEGRARLRPAEAMPHLPVSPGGGHPTCRRPRGDTPHPTCCRFSTRSFLRIWMHLTA